MDKYNILACICAIGAVILAGMSKDPVTVSALIGLAGTTVGRGKK